MANRTVSTLTAVLQMNNTKFKKGLTASEKALNAFKKQVQYVGGAIAGAFTVNAIGNLAKDSLMLAGQMQGVALAFERVRPSVGFMKELQAATHGTVSELELMKRTVTAKNLGIALESFPELLRFATKRAQETGESVDYLVNSIVTGIGRKSTLILDNLGISAVALRDKLDGVGVAAASVADVTKAVSEIAQESLAEAGDVVDTFATSWERVKAGIDNAKVALGNFLLGQTETDERVRSFADKTLWLWGGFLEGGILDAETASNKFNKSLAIANGEFEKTRDLTKTIDLKNLFTVESDSLVSDWGLNNLFDLSFAISKLAEDVKKLEPDLWKEPPGFVEAWSGDKVFGLDWTQDPSINEGLTTIQDVMASLDAFANEGLAGVEQFVGDIPEKVIPAMQELGKMVGTSLVAQFDQLGYAIGQFAQGAAGAFNNLGATILQNLGYILIMMGAQLGPAGLPLLLAGIGIQLGGGILKGLGRNVRGDALATGNSSGQVNFKISGQNLVGVLDRQNIKTNMST